VSSAPLTEIVEFVDFLSKERNDSPPHREGVRPRRGRLRRVSAPVLRRRRVELSRAWTRLAIRGWLGALQQRGLAKRSAARALSALRTFYRFLNITRGLEVNPAKAARTPRLERTLPEHLDTRGGRAAVRRGRAAGAGGRFSPRRGTWRCSSCSTPRASGSPELAGLNQQDVDLVSDQVKVRGKGKKERLVPSGATRDARCAATIGSAMRWGARERATAGRCSWGGAGSGCRRGACSSPSNDC